MYISIRAMRDYQSMNINIIHIKIILNILE